MSKYDKQVNCLIIILFVYWCCLCTITNGESKWQTLRKEQRIVGGTYIKKPSKFPYLVSLQKYNGDHICGGSILNKDTVVTAAHCCAIIQHSYKKYKIVGGMVDLLSKDKFVRKIKNVIQHKEFSDDTYENDLCLLKIRPLKFSNSVKPIKLETTFQKKETRCRIAGWGKHVQDLDTEQDHLLKGALVEISNQRKCARNYLKLAKEKVYLGKMICAGTDEGLADACQGDSGGPLVCDNKLTGVVSWGYGCANKDLPGIYVKVKYYLKWFEQHGIEIS